MSSQQKEIEKKLVEHLVNRFLGWRLPSDFHPDGGIMFMDVYDNGTEQGGTFEPTGTNLFTAEQAKEMFRFLLEHKDGTPILTKLLHQELQKARHDWLREEIVKLEGMKRQHYDETAFMKHRNDFNDAYNDVIQPIIDRYHSELD